MATSRISEGWKIVHLINKKGFRITVSGNHAIKLFERLGYVEEKPEQDKEGNNE